MFWLLLLSLVFSMCWKFRHMMASQVHKLPNEKNFNMNNFHSRFLNEQNNYFFENLKHKLNNHTWSDVFFVLIFLIVLPVISCTTLLSKIGKLPRPRCARVSVSALSLATWVYFFSLLTTNTESLSVKYFLGSLSVKWLLLPPKDSSLFNDLFYQ